MTDIFWDKKYVKWEHRGLWFDMEVLKIPYMALIKCFKQSVLIVCEYVKL